MSSPKIYFKQPQEPPIRFPAHFLQFPRIVGGGVGLFFRRSDDRVDLRGKATKQFGYFRDYFLLYSQVITEDSYKTQPTKMVQIAFAGKDHISYLGKFGKSSTQKCRLGWDMGQFPGGYCLICIFSHDVLLHRWGKGWTFCSRHFVRDTPIHPGFITVRIAGVQKSKHPLVN